MIWYIADSHFLHFNSAKIFNRPFISREEMKERLIEEWNKVVKPSDIVRHVGDFAARGSARLVAELLSRLNGEIHLILGNHDENALKAFNRINKGDFPEFKKNFASIKNYDSVCDYGQTIILSHYAFRVWWHYKRGSWHLYGHTHAELRPLGKSVDIGVDNVKNIVPGAFYRPISFDELKSYMDKRPLRKNLGLLDMVQMLKLRRTKWKA